MVSPKFRHYMVRITTKKNAFFRTALEIVCIKDIHKVKSCIIMQALNEKIKKNKLQPGSPVKEEHEDFIIHCLEALVIHSCHKRYKLPGQK
ncbi:hypothetical protein L345_00424, partial [Ophiophagus hannah]